jgi:hypothetical protein
MPADGERLAGVFVSEGEVASLVASPVRLSGDGVLAVRVAELSARVEALEMEALNREKEALLAGLPSEQEEQARLAALAAEVLEGVDLGEAEPEQAQEPTESTVADTQSDGPEPAVRTVQVSDEDRQVLSELAIVLARLAMASCPACGWKVADDAEECPHCGAELAAETVAAACECGGTCGECATG